MNAPMGLFVKFGNPVPLKGVRMDARIRDLFCDVSVEQVYENAEKKPIEAVYTFPLAVDAVLLDVEVMLGDKKLRGEVVAKAVAEMKYEKAIVEGDAAIRLEKLEGGMYAMNLGNVNPGERVSVCFRYGQLLRWNGDAVRFHVPTTIAPRYGASPHAAHHAPDAELLAENRFSMKIEIAGTLAEAVIDCPTHPLSTRHRKGVVELSLAGKQSFMDRDLVVNLRVAEGKRSGAVVVPHGDGRVAMLSWRPSLATDNSTRPRALKVVVDCSGSMNGDSINQARVALTAIVRSLRPQDCFDIVFFGDRRHTLFGSLQSASPRNVEVALATIAQMQADMGGTNIDKALNEAYKLKGADAETRPDVLLITDGEVSNTKSIVKAAQASRHRIFTVGVGSSVAEAFVRELATVSGGACELVSPNEEMASRVVRHFQRMYAPVLEDIRIQWPGEVLREVRSSGAVFSGDTVHAYAWLKAGGTGEIGIQFDADNDKVSNETVGCETIDVDRAHASPGHPIARMAAAAWIAQSPEDMQRIAVEYQLVTEQTDFIVVHERTEAEKAKGLPELRKVDGMLAAGWGGTGETRIWAVEADSSLMAVEAPAPLSRRMTYGVKDSRSRAGVPKKSPPPVAWDEICKAIEQKLSFDPATARYLRCDLDMLRDAGVEAHIMDELSRLVAAGQDEYQVVLAFLLALVRSPSGSGFSRDGRRQIEKAGQGLSIGDAERSAIAALVNAVLHKPSVLGKAVRGLGGIFR